MTEFLWLAYATVFIGSAGIGWTLEGHEKGVMAKTEKTATPSPTKELTLAQAPKCRVVRRETMNNLTE